MRLDFSTEVASSSRWFDDIGGWAGAELGDLSALSTLML
jgi:hypothetical protein